MSPLERKRVVERLRWLEEDLRGDVKHLSNHIPEYRMRAGWRLEGAFRGRRRPCRRVSYPPQKRSLPLTAMSIHPQIIEKDGKKEFVILSYEEFLRVQEALEDYEDLRTLRDEKAAAAQEPTRALDEVLKEIKD